jgi:hypothetical protein
MTPRKLEEIQRLIDSVENERVELETVRQLGVDASSHPAHRSLYFLTSLASITVLGICSALAALMLNFVIVVWVFHLSFE